MKSTLSLLLVFLNQFFNQAALDPLNGEFLMQVIGVLETPFVA